MSKIGDNDNEVRKSLTERKQLLAALAKVNSDNPEELVKVLKYILAKLIMAVFR